MIGPVPLNKPTTGVAPTTSTTNKFEVQASGEINNFKNEQREDQNNLFNYSDTVSYPINYSKYRLQGADPREKIEGNLVSSDLTSVTSAEEQRVLMI